MKKATDLQFTIKSLEEKIEQREQLIIQHEKVIAQRDTLIALLQEKLRQADIVRFSAKSEKSSSDQLGLFDEAELNQMSEEPDKD